MSCIPQIFTPMTCGDRFIGNTSHGDTGEHYFSLTMPAGTTSIRADTCLSKFDTKLSLYENMDLDFCAGISTVLARNDDDATGTCAAMGDPSSLNSVINFDDLNPMGDNLVYAARHPTALVAARRALARSRARRSRRATRRFGAPRRSFKVDGYGGSDGEYDLMVICN